MNAKTSFPAPADSAHMQSSSEPGRFLEITPGHRGKKGNKERAFQPEVAFDQLRRVSNKLSSYSNLRLCSDSSEWLLFFISPRMRWSRSSGSAVYDFILLSVFFLFFSCFLLIRQTENILWSVDRAGEISSCMKQQELFCRGPNRGPNTCGGLCTTVKIRYPLYDILKSSGAICLMLEVRETQSGNGRWLLAFSAAMTSHTPILPKGLTLGLDLWPVSQVLKTVCEAEPLLSFFLQPE